ncbi:MAG: hypothetical protein WAJ87_14905 [Bryobacteraceae bacterium]
MLTEATAAELVLRPPVEEQALRQLAQERAQQAAVQWAAAVRAPASASAA